MQLLEALHGLTPGTPQLLLCSEPRLALLHGRRGGLPEADNPRHRVVAVIWYQLPGLREQISNILDRFAELSRALYPNWCTPSGRPVNPIWRIRAQERCQSGELPSALAPPAEQLRQLALTLGEEVTTLLVVDQTVQARTALLALTRTAEWAARASEGRIAILAASCLGGHSELRRLSYSAINLESPSKDGAMPFDTPGVVEYEPDASAQRATIAALWPVEGHPHFASPGEQMLAKALDAAADLRGLFEFNRRVATSTGMDYRVDLLWREGRLVIEVDGYQYHSDREAFAADRQRDYALLISGYYVLRITYDEVRFDMTSVLAKIRAVIAFLLRSRAPEAVAPLEVPR